MARYEVVRCEHCNRGRVPRFEIGLDGQLVDLTSPCGCPESRRLRGICLECEEPVEGTPRRALRCARHKKAAATAASARWRQRHPRKVRAIQARTDALRKTPEGRAHRRQYEREHRSRPEIRARIKEQRRRRAMRNPWAKSEAHRRYREKYPERVQAQQRAANRRRAHAKREYMHRYATKYGLRPPRCKKCGGEVPFEGKGRPMLRCPVCDPTAWRNRARRQQARARYNERH